MSGFESAAGWVTTPPTVINPYLWYAYMRTHGQLYRRYVGKTAVLTQVKLDEVAAWLNEIW